MTFPSSSAIQEYRSIRMKGFKILLWIVMKKKKAQCTLTVVNTLAVWLGWRCIMSQFVLPPLVYFPVLSAPHLCCISWSLTPVSLFVSLFCLSCVSCCCSCSVLPLCPCVSLSELPVVCFRLLVFWFVLCYAFVFLGFLPFVASFWDLLHLDLALCLVTCLSVCLPSGPLCFNQNKKITFLIVQHLYLYDFSYMDMT